MSKPPWAYSGVQSKMGEVRKFPPKISILVHPKQFFSGFKNKKNKKKKKKKDKVLCSLSYLSPFHFKFSSTILQFSLKFNSLSMFPFPIFPCLSFPFPPFLPSPFPFPSSFPFSSFPPSFQNFPQTFLGWATRPLRPPLVTPLQIIGGDARLSILL